MKGGEGDNEAGGGIEGRMDVWNEKEREGWKEEWRGRREGRSEEGR